MSEIVWRPHPTVPDCELGKRPDGRVYVVNRGDDPPAGHLRGFVLYRSISIPIPGERMDLEKIGWNARMWSAKDQCECDLTSEREAQERAQMSMPENPPDNYALPPFEPSGDPEWDKRAKGGVESDGY